MNFIKEMYQHLITLIEDLRTAIVAWLATTGTGAATYVDVLDKWTGIITCLVGVLISSVLAVLAWRKENLAEGESNAFRISEEGEIQATEDLLKLIDLYDEGFKRLGCVLCPFARNTKQEIARFPKIANLWLLACNRLVEYRLTSGREYKHQFLI